MDFNSVFLTEDDLNCSENFGYSDNLYNSPTYSDDSGFGQAFSLDDILLSDVLPPSLNDEDFTESLKTFDCSKSVSSSIHDHSYFISNQQGNREIKLPEITKVSNKKGVKRVIADSNLNQDQIPLKKVKKENDSHPASESDINIIHCDNDTFSYKDESGKTVIVDRSRKNAEMAKLNRQRKKRYISNLESEVKSLKGRNGKLMVLKNQHEKKIDNLENEVAYLMSVIRNQTKLSSVLKAVSSVSGISIPKEMEKKSNTKINLVQCLPGKRAPVEIEEEEYTGGVCLHVSDNSVSLEFCASCNKKQKN